MHDYIIPASEKNGGGVSDGSKGQLKEDRDADGVGDDCDNCPNESNPEQISTDRNFTGDVCDFDDDNDGIGKKQNIFVQYVPLG